MPVPYWVEDAVFYQIFPDRFANGDPSNDPPNLTDWLAAPTRNSFHGGDLRGIIQNLDYILDLGITAIYLNPIFQASSNHRYNAADYLVVDPKLGSLQDFRSLMAAAHTNGLRVILDGVFNHCGRGFYPFNDVLENQENSPFRDWFHINKFPVDAYSPGDAKDYLGWWKLKSLPKFNTDNLQVRKYLLKVARYWIEQGADGWRLDVPNEIDDDSFWSEFRQVVKDANPNAHILGEIWNVWPRWVGDGHCDSLMNYPLREAILGLFTGKYSLVAFADRAEQLLTVYPRENVYAMYNLLGSHDTERLLTAFEDNLPRVLLAYSFLFAYPGSPAVYYGDEIGLRGGKDPECRAAFPWQPEVWNSELRNWIKKLISLRKQYASLRRGEYRRVALDENRTCYAFARVLGNECILALMNTGRAKRNLRISVSGLNLPDGRILHDLLGSSECIVSGDDLSVTLPPMTMQWLI